MNLLTNGNTRQLLAATLLFLLLWAILPAETGAHPASTVAQVLDHDERIVEIHALGSLAHTPEDFHKVRWSGNGFTSRPTLMRDSLAVAIPPAYGSAISIQLAPCAWESRSLVCYPCPEEQCRARVQFVSSYPPEFGILDHVVATGDRPLEYSFTDTGARVFRIGLTVAAFTLVAVAGLALFLVLRR